jgi:hypothetical protein
MEVVCVVETVSAGHPFGQRPLSELERLGKVARRASLSECLALERKGSGQTRGVA